MKSSKKETKTKTATRSSRSPARGVSRSPGRKSPGRPRKSPARKSPSRKSPDPPRSPSRRTAPVKADKSPKPEQKRRTTDTVNGLRERKPADAPPPPPPSARRSTKTGKPTAAETSSYEALLKLARSKELPRRTKPSVSLSDEDSASEEETPVRVTRSGTRKLVTPLQVQEVRKPTRLETVLLCVSLIGFVAVVVAVNGVCSGSSCSFSDLSGVSVKSLVSVGRWLKSPPAVSYCSLVLIVTLVSCLPCMGKRVSASDGSGFVANGWVALLVSLVTAVSVNKLYYPLFETITRDWLSMILPAGVLGVVVGISVFLTGRGVPEEARNEAGSTGVFLNDLLVGRVTNPILFKCLNVKVALYRIALVSAVLLNVAVLYQGVSLKPSPALTPQSLLKMETLKRLVASVSVDPTLFLISSLQIVYFVHGILSEANFVSTFEVQQEGTGSLLSIGYLLYPFTTPLISKYVLRSGIVLSNAVLLIILTVYVIGFYIYHASNSQKNAFRRNPFDPKLAHLDSLPTFQGKRLLISGWWGFLRHPNYLGDIILHLSLALAVITAPPIIFIILTVIFLVHRASRDDTRCRKRYGAAWDRYCSRVPRVLIPKIY